MDTQMNDADLEALILKELEALQESDLDDDDDTVEEVENSHSKVDIKNESGEPYECMEEYLSLIKIYNEEAEKRMSETEDMINALANIRVNTDDLLQKKLCDELGGEREDVMQVWKKVCIDIDVQELEEGSPDSSEKQPTLFQNEMDDIALLEFKAQQELDSLLEQQQLPKDLCQQEITNHAELLEMQVRQEARVKQLEELKQVLTEDTRQEDPGTIAASKTYGGRSNGMTADSLKVEVNEKLQQIDESYHAEKAKLESLQKEMREITKVKENWAAVTIQKYMKRYHVQKVYSNKVKQIKDAVISFRKDQVATMVKEQEKVLADRRRKEEELAKKKELERLEKKKLEKEKEERKQKYEEQKILLAKEKAETERKEKLRQAEEKKVLEEENRKLEDERKKQEAEKKKKEEEELTEDERRKEKIKGKEKLEREWNNEEERHRKENEGKARELEEERRREENKRRELEKLEQEKKTEEKRQREENERRVRELEDRERLKAERNLLTQEQEIANPGDAHLGLELEKMKLNEKKDTELEHKQGEEQRKEIDRQVYEEVQPISIHNSTQLLEIDVISKDGMADEYKNIDKSTDISAEPTEICIDIQGGTGTNSDVADPSAMDYAPADKSLAETGSASLDDMMERLTAKRKERYLKRLVPHAVKIQSFYRGYRVRKAYAEVKRLQADMMETWSNGDSDDSNCVYDEVNLDEFELDNSMLEWTPSMKTPPMLHEPPLPDISPSAHKPGVEISVKEAWHQTEAEEGASLFDTSEKKPFLELSPTSVATGAESVCSRNTSAASSCKSMFSGKAGKISSEWGFQNEVTAELMLKRSKKLGTGKKKAVSSYDRYELFKKASNVPSQGKHIASGRKKGPERVSYFQASREPPSPLDHKELHEKDKATYSWVCSQPVLHADRAQEVLSRNSKFYTENTGVLKKDSSMPEIETITLPPIDPAVLAGKPPSLVQSEVHNPQVPVLKERRASGSERVRKSLVETKSHSAPTRKSDKCESELDRDRKWTKYAYR